MRDTVIVTFNLRPRERGVVADAIGGVARVVYLTDLDDAGRPRRLRKQPRSWRVTPARIFTPTRLGTSVRRAIQFVTAGIDFVPLAALPSGIPVASNGGAYAEQMAEHGLAMVLAAAKRLLIEHAALARGEFNQEIRNRTLAGKVCGILGFGGIGIASARLMRALGMRIHAINRRGSPRSRRTGSALPGTLTCCWLPPMC